jgi:hypothetical protein
MYRKDHILNETERLARLIAKLLGLKAMPDKDEEVQQVYYTGLQEEYNITPDDLTAIKTEDFEAWLKQQNLSIPKLDTLAQLLYHDAVPFKADTQTLTQLRKVLIIYNMLEQEHHQQSFDNISKRSIIQQYIQKHNG